MLRSLLVVSFILSTLGLAAQVGITGFYNFNDARVVGKSVDPANNQIRYDHGPEVALNYWFRLPTKRVEFQPTVYYASSGSQTDWREAGFQFKTNLYLFDFGTDCDCPTFGKQGPQLEKGFFLQLSPGVARHWNTNTSSPDVAGTAFTLGAGLGLDIGVSNLITVTPIASMRHSVTDLLGVVYTDENNEPVDVGSRLTSFQLGVQMTFRMDKKRY